MSGFSVLTASAAITCCFIACKVEPADPSSGDAPEAGGTVSAAGHAGRGSSSASHAGRKAVPDSEGGAGGSAQAGSGEDSAGEGGVANTRAGSGSGGMVFELEVAGEGGALPTNCEQANATCAVISQPACEFAENVGKSAVVNCGQSAVVADIACGECGQVDVVVYFDGKNCWQGAPDCNATSFRGKYLYPHAP